MFLRGLKSERGSISVITIGLFVVLVSTVLLLTNISSIYLAKRSLSLATEAAVQRGMKNLDAERYYSGEYNLNRMLKNTFVRGDSDPGIPIDCQAGARDSREVLDNWQGREASLTRGNLENLQVIDFQCDGFHIYMKTSAFAYLPIPLPFLDMEGVTIKTYAGAIGERAESNNFYGLDIG